MSVEVQSMSDSDVPEVVLQHASYLYQVMVWSHTEFHRVLYSSKLTDGEYLISTGKFLKNLNVIYEDKSKPEVIIHFEKQISIMLIKYLPELACIAFKALKDGYSDSWSGQLNALTSLT